MWTQDDPHVNKGYLGHGEYILDSCGPLDVLAVDRGEDTYHMIIIIVWPRYGKNYG